MSPDLVSVEDRAALRLHPDLAEIMAGGRH